MTGHATHGHTRSRAKSPEFRSWCAMRARCTNPKNDRYARYGGRGVRVCQRWLDSFEAFLADVGPRPSPRHTLDRKNGDGDYEPGNCRWATSEEQAANRSNNRVIAWRGEQRTLAEWARHLGMTASRLQSRLARGWPLELAFDATAGRRERLASLGRLKPTAVAPEVHACPECAAPFARIRGRLFCSKACRIRHCKNRWYAAQRDAINERRRARRAAERRF